MPPMTRVMTNWRWSCATAGFNHRPVIPLAMPGVDRTDRSMDTLTILDTQADRIVLRLRDNAEVDGDTMSVLHNGRPLLTAHALTKTRARARRCGVRVQRSTLRGAQRGQRATQYRQLYRTLGKGKRGVARTYIAQEGPGGGHRAQVTHCAGMVNRAQPIAPVVRLEGDLAPAHIAQPQWHGAHLAARIPEVLVRDGVFTIGQHMEHHRGVVAIGLAQETGGRSLLHGHSFELDDVARKRLVLLRVSTTLPSHRYRPSPRAHC